MYTQLYKFDVKSELGDYNLPFGEEEEKKKPKPGDKIANMSNASSFYENDEKSETDKQESEQDNESEVQTKPNYTSIVKGLFNQST